MLYDINFKGSYERYTYGNAVKKRPQDKLRLIKSASAAGAQPAGKDFRMYNLSDCAALPLTPKRDAFIKESRDDESEKQRRNELRQKRAYERHKKVIRQRIALSLAALGVTTGIITGASLSRKNTTPVNEPIAVVETTAPAVTMTPEEIDKMAQENAKRIYEEQREVQINSAKDIISSIPQVNENVQRFNDAISRFSDEMGQDGLSLIKNRIDAIGNGVVDTADVLKILWIESKGRVFDPKDPDKLLPSFTGEAFGPFQLTPATVDYLNEYFNLEGTEKELDINDPYDNLDACIYNIRFLKEKREKDIKNGLKLPTGDDLMRAVIWSYHDGAWATNVSTYGKDYIRQYDELSCIDEYSAVVAYVTDTFN